MTPRVPMPNNLVTPAAVIPPRPAPLLAGSNDHFADRAAVPDVVQGVERPGKRSDVGDQGIHLSGPEQLDHGVPVFPKSAGPAGEMGPQWTPTIE